MSVEQFPNTTERHSSPEQSRLYLGNQAVEAELSEGRALEVHDALQRAKERFPELGEATEAYALHIGTEVTVPVMNFSTKPITERAASTIASATERVNWVLGSENMAGMETAIAVIPGGAAVAGTKIIANADRQTHIVRISEDVLESDEHLTEQMRQDYKSMLGEGRPPGEETIVHELGHVAEFTATSHRVGESDPRIVNDLFNSRPGDNDMYAIRKSGPQDISSARVNVFREGEYVEMTGSEAYGEQATVEAPTAYSRKRPGEYFAESFTGHAYGGQVARPLIDMVRATIDTQMPAGMAVAGPHEQAVYERVV